MVNLFACITTPSVTNINTGLTQIFGGFVAYGISFYDGHAIAPYKIIYLLLGGLAIAVGVCVLIWLPDSPVNARVLSKEERIAALERVRDDQGGTTNKKWKKDQIIEALTDPRSWLIVLSTLMSTSSCVVFPYETLLMAIACSECSQWRF